MTVFTPHYVCDFADFRFVSDRSIAIEGATTSCLYPKHRPWDLVAFVAGDRLVSP